MRGRSAADIAPLALIALAGIAAAQGYPEKPIRVLTTATGGPNDQEIVRVLQRAETKERLSSYGIEAIPGTPEEFAATIRSEMARMDKVIRESRLRE